MKIFDQSLIFIKTPSTLIAFNDNIIYPKRSTQLDYEAELAVFIKNRIENTEFKEVFRIF